MGSSANVIVPGNILVLNLEMPHMHKCEDKLFVVACDDPILLLKINTDYEQRDIARRFNERQFKLKCSIYSLDHDSYLDCGTAWKNLLTEQEIISQNPKILGALIPDHKNEVLRLTDKSKSITAYHKRLIRECMKR